VTENLTKVEEIDEKKPLNVATLIKLCAQLIHMYTTASEVQVGSYADHWRAGRYRLELKAELDGDLHDMDTALEKLVYRIVDADQWGRSYRHRDDPGRTAEIDEQEYPARSLRVILQREDLDETDVERAEDELVSIYRQMYSARTIPNPQEDQDYETFLESRN